jgi:hypothetical protein
MFVDISFAIFVTAFVSVVVLGQMLLITAIWPNPLDERRERRLGTVDINLPLVH